MVNDSNAQSNTAVTSTVDTVHVAPTINVSGAPNYFGGSAPVTLDAGLTVSDPDSGGMLAGATVAITAGTFANDDDVLAATTAGTSITASYNSASEILTLSGADTLAHYQQVLASVTFQSTNINPSDSGADNSRTITWTVNDGNTANNLGTATQIVTTVDASWTKIDNGMPTAMAGGDYKGLGTAQLAASEAGYGTYLWVNGVGWNKIDGSTYTIMTAADLYGTSRGNANNADLAAYDPTSLGLYTWQSNYGWAKIDSGTVAAMTSGNFGGSGAELIASDAAAGAGTGTFTWSPSAGWSRIDGAVYTIMAAGDFYGASDGNNNNSDLAAFDPGVGTYIWASSVGWTKIDSGTASAFAAGNFLGTADNNTNETDLAAYFPGSGTFIWSQNAGWTEIDSRAGAGMTAIQATGNGQSQLIEYFPGSGMQEWQAGAGWTTYDNTSALPTNASQALFADGNFLGGADVIGVTGFANTGGVWLDPPAPSPDTNASQGTASSSNPVSVLGIDPAGSSGPGVAPVTVGDGATVDIATPSAAAATFAGTSGALQLDQSSSFTGTVAGFTGQDQLDLTDIAFTANTTLGYAANAAGSAGTLTVSNGGNTANIALLGSYIASSFVTSSDGNGGTLISEAAQITAQTTPLAQPHAAV